MLAVKQMQSPVGTWKIVLFDTKRDGRMTASYVLWQQDIPLSGSEAIGESLERAMSQLSQLQASLWTPILVNK